MLNHYWKTALQVLLKDKYYTLVNLLGITLAVICSLLLFFVVQQEWSYDKQYPDADRIYRVLNVNTSDGGHFASASIRPTVNRDWTSMPAIEYATFIYNQNTFFSHGESDPVEMDIATVSPSFFGVFQYQLLRGSGEGMTDAKKYLISEEGARKLFGGMLCNQFLVDFLEQSYEVIGIVKVPKNSHVKFDLLEVRTSYPSGGVHYIKVKKEADLNTLHQQMQNYPADHRGMENTVYTLQPLLDVHLHSPKEVSEAAYLERYGNNGQVNFFLIAACVILLISIINYVNLSVARTLNRMKEIGVRKISGSSQWQLAARFFLEPFIISSVAVLLALIPVWLFLPQFSAMLGQRIDFVFDLQTLLILAVTILVITILSGGYAAFYLTSLNPIQILRGGNSTGSSQKVRTALLGLQFFVSVFVVFCAIVVQKQISSLVNADIGVDRKNILVIESNLWYGAQDFIQEIKRNSAIITASIAANAPYNSTYAYGGIEWDGKRDEAITSEFNEISCDSNFAEVFGLQVTQGEFIKPGLTWWQYAEKESFDIVINETFKELMGVENPIGTRVNYSHGFTGKVIGVVKDFNFRPLKEKIGPMVISFNPESCSKIYVKLTDNINTQQIHNWILDKYKEMRPDKKGIIPKTYFAEQEYLNMYQSELQTVNILYLASIITFLLSAMGIISMVSILIQKRTKEIAIRKVNGAMLGDILVLFTKNFGKIFLASSFIAVLLGYFIMRNWLMAYIYQTNINWLLLVGLPLFIVLVASIMVSMQVRFFAASTPISALKND